MRERELDGLARLRLEVRPRSVDNEVLAVFENDKTFGNGKAVNAVGCGSKRISIRETTAVGYDDCIRAVLNVSVRFDCHLELGLAHTGNLKTELASDAIGGIEREVLSLVIFMIYRCHTRITCVNRSVSARPIGNLFHHVPVQKYAGYRG